jgi:hypothetical protein
MRQSAHIVLMVAEWRLSCAVAGEERSGTVWHRLAPRPSFPLRIRLRGEAS